MASTSTVAQCIAIVRTAGYSLPPEASAAALAKVWSMVFSKVSDEELEAALGTFLAGERFSRWPVPGQIMQHVPSVAASKALEATDDGDEAFGRAYALMWSFPPGEVPAPTLAQLHPYEPKARAIQAAIAACGGWRGFHAAVNEHEASAKKAFKGAYKSAAVREQVKGGWDHHLASANPEPRLFASTAAPLALPAPQNGERKRLPVNLGAELGAHLSREDAS